MDFTNRQTDNQYNNIYNNEFLNSQIIHSTSKHNVNVNYVVHAWLETTIKIIYNLETEMINSKSECRDETFTSPKSIKSIKNRF